MEGMSLSQQGWKGCAECCEKMRRKMLDLREEKQELKEVGAYLGCCGCGLCGMDVSLGSARLSPSHRVPHFVMYMKAK